jgi:hypothetical protein
VDHSGTTQAVPAEGQRRVRQLRIRVRIGSDVVRGSEHYLQSAFIESRTDKAQVPATGDRFAIKVPERHKLSAEGSLIGDRTDECGRLCSGTERSIHTPVLA